MDIAVPLLFDQDHVYVKDMTEHHQLDETMEGLINYGSPVLAANSTLLGATAIIPGGVIKPGTVKNGLQVSQHFGRTLNITATAAGAVVIRGRDYLNQLMSEIVTCINGTVSTLKAFKFVDSITSTALTGNISIGPGTKLGFPFVASVVLNEYADGVAVSTPTTTVPVTAVPTSSTGDVRGTVAPTTTLDGVKNVQMKVRFFAGAVGGLFGQPQA